MLDRYRDNVDWLFDWTARHTTIQPHILTALSLVAAALAGVSFFFSYHHTWLLVVGTGGVLANGFLDALDGKVARLRGLASPKGDFIDHAVDRFADVLIVGGIAASSWCSPVVGIMALAGILLTSYMGTQAQAVGYGREYGGLLGRADRLVILMVTPLVQFVMKGYGITLFDESLITWVMAFFAVVGTVTAIQRFTAVLHWFSE
jgi:archaetidylinositol phosphate synthase